MRAMLPWILALSATIATLDAHAETIGVPPSIAQAAPQAQPGAPASAARPPVRLPQRIEILRFDNWAVTCNEFADTPNKRACNAELHAEGSASGGARVIIVLTLYINDAKQLVGVLRTPTGVMLAPGVELKFDEAGDKTGENAGVNKFIYESCETNGCVATSILDSAFIRHATSAPATTVIMRAANGGTVQFKLPIQGFDKAYDQLKASTN